MMSKRTYSFLLITFGVIGMGTRAVDAQDSEAGDESAAKIARQAYDLLLDQYRAGEGGAAQLERLNHWSTRILQAEFTEIALIGVTKPEALKKSLDDHFERMRKLENLVEKRFEAAQASQAELLAAKYFRLERQGIEQMITSMQQLLVPVDGDFNIEMPKVVDAKPAGPAPVSIKIDVDARGKISIAGKELTLKQLETRIEKIVKESAHPVGAHIRVHPDCLHRGVVHVSNVCFKAGTQSLSLKIAEDQPPEK